MCVGSQHITCSKTQQEENSTVVKALKEKRLGQFSQSVGYGSPVGHEGTVGGSWSLTIYKGTNKRLILNAVIKL